MNAPGAVSLSLPSPIVAFPFMWENDARPRTPTMIIHDLRMRLRADLESPQELRQLGTGWLSGTAAVIFSIAGLFFVLCLRYPALLTVPQARPLYESPWFRLVLHFMLIGAFALAALSLVLRTNKVLGFSA